MIRTFNRQPVSVGTPSSNDSKDYFFTQSNWKGLYENENFVNVDQESFSECKNVYVNSQGLLSSRPSVKNVKIKVLLDGKNVVLSNVEDIYVFEDITVYKTYANGSYFLTFINKDNNLQVSCNKNVKLILTERKIFVFSSTSLNYYDVETNEYNDATDFIYVPVTKVFENNISTMLETENELTSSHIIRYLYTNISSLNFDKFVGKTYKVKIDDKEYDITFSLNTYSIILGKYLTLNNTNFNNSNLLGVGTYKSPFVEVSENGICLVSSNLNGNWTISYTLDGIVYNMLPTVIDVISKPLITDDGTCAIVFKKDGPYAYSLLSTDEDKKLFVNWTNLLTYHNYSSSLDLNEGNGNTCQITGHFITYDNFCFTFGKNNFDNNIPPVKQYTSFNSLSCVSCINGEIFIHDIFDNSKVNCKTNDLIATLEGNAINNYDYLYENSNPSNVYIKDTSENNTDVSYKIYELSIPIGSNELTYTIDVYRGNTRIKQYIKTLLLYKGITSYIASDVELGLTFEYYTVQYNKYIYIYNNNDNLGKFYPYVCDYSPVVKFNRFANNASFTLAFMMYDNITSIYEKVEIFNYSNSEWSSLNYRNYNFEKNSKNIFNNDLYYLSDYILYVRILDDIISLNTYNISKGYVNSYFVNENTDKCKISLSGTYLITNDNMYLLSFSYSDEKFSAIHYEKLLFNCYPIKMLSNILYVTDNEYLYKSDSFKLITIDEFVQGENNYIVPNNVKELNVFYASVNNKLLISSYPSDGIFKWYFPKINTEVIDYEITNLHPISSTEMAVFTEHNVYYIQTTENGYSYIKSKLQVGCKKGADVITTFDSKYIIFATERGLVAMTYQELVASTEQVLNYLSDNILNTFKVFSNSAIKLFKYDYWIACYKSGSSSVLLFDLRNNSWWPIELNDAVNTIVIEKSQPVILCNNKIYKFFEDDAYVDNNGIVDQAIEWSIVSQKLHLNAINYLKHISNITLTSVLDMDNPISLDLTITNYRKIANISKAQSFEYYVDAIRIFVKRLNYSKVNEFQYKLEYDSERSSSNVPLRLSNINIKYKISGQVR